MAPGIFMFSLAILIINFVTATYSPPTIHHPLPLCELTSHATLWFPLWLAHTIGTFLQIFCSCNIIMESMHKYTIHVTQKITWHAIHTQILAKIMIPNACAYKILQSVALHLIFHIYWKVFFFNELSDQFKISLASSMVECSYLTL